MRLPMSGAVRIGGLVLSGFAALLYFTVMLVGYNFETVFSVLVAVVLGLCSFGLSVPRRVGYCLAGSLLYEAVKLVLNVGRALYASSVLGGYFTLYMWVYAAFWSWGLTLCFSLLASGLLYATEKLLRLNKR